MPAGSPRFDAANELKPAVGSVELQVGGKRVPCFAAMLEKITLQLAVRRTIVSSNSASRILRPRSIKARRAKFRVNSIPTMVAALFTVRLCDRAGATELKDFGGANA